MKVRLGDLTRIKTGKLDANASSPDGVYPFFTCSKEPLRIDSYSYDCECVLVAGNGDLNVKYYHGKFDAYQRTYIIESNGNGKLFMPYLYYFMDGYLDKLRKMSIGGVIKYIKLGNLTDALIELPDYETQKQVVRVLNKVEEVITARQQELQKLDELVKARFVELFGECEEHKRLGEYASLITKGASPKWQGVDYCEDGTLFVTSENVREGYLDLSKRKSLDDKINEIQPRSILKRNDILINIVGASIGRAAVYDCDEIANINQAVALVRVDYSQINQTYLMTFLNSPQAIEMYGKMKKGGARDNLSLQNIADLQIPVAPMELQNQFADFVEQTDKSKVVESIHRMNVLFNITLNGGNRYDIRANEF